MFMPARTLCATLRQNRTNRSLFARVIRGWKTWLRARWARDSGRNPNNKKDCLAIHTLPIPSRSQNLVVE